MNPNSYLIKEALAAVMTNDRVRMRIMYATYRLNAFYGGVQGA
jgi:hypothetical protein